jgi:glycosyltransferase involved in cell wall biosynthesis
LIRVLELIATLDPDGAQRQLVGLVTRLNRERFEPAVCALTRGGPLEEPLRARGVPLRILGKRWKFDFAVLGKIRAMIGEFGPDVVHTWMFTANAFGRRVAFDAGVRAVIASERNEDVWKPWLYRWIDRRYARRTFAVVGNAQGVIDYCVREEKIPAEKTRVIENGLDVDRLVPRDAAGFRARLGLPDGARLIGTAARLAPQKSLHTLIEATARLRAEVCCLIAGEGPLRGELERRIERAGLAPRCRLIGYVEPVADLLANLEVFVLPSIFEGSPNVLQEAMAMGRACVATDIPGVRETLRDRQTGLRVAPERPDLLADAIATLLADEDLRGVLGARARADALERFSMDRMVRAYEALYEEATR